jgi:hypothetical protein
MRYRTFSTNHFCRVRNTLTEASSEDFAARPSERIESLRPIVLSGKIDAGIDLRGAVVIADFLVLGVDQGHQLQIFRREQRSDTWCLQQSLSLADQDQETDIEAISFGVGCLYIVGSHSFRRRRMRPDLSVRKNLQRLQDIDSESSRNRLYRLPFDLKSGKLGKVDWIDLSKRLRKDPLLKSFYGIPGKENGIDIEGMTFRHERLYLGFRGPVLRDNYVPVMVLEFERPKDYQSSFVRLDGHGIRDMAALEHGFLILSGPVNDAPGPFLLWWWDGENQVPGKGRVVQDAVMLGAVSTRGGAKAEGLALLDESEGHAHVILVYETDAAPQLVRMRVTLPD